MQELVSFENEHVHAKIMKDVIRWGNNCKRTEYNVYWKAPDGMVWTHCLNTKVRRDAYRRLHNIAKYTHNGNVTIGNSQQRIKSIVVVPIKFD